MKKYFVTNLLLSSILTFVPGHSFAQDTCLQNLSRVDACPNLIYRGVTEPKTQERIVFCFCKTDFNLMLNEEVNDRQKMLNKMEWQELLVATGYSDSELRNLVKP